MNSSLIDLSHPTPCVLNFMKIFGAISEILDYLYAKIAIVSNSKSYSKKKNLYNFCYSY